MMMIKHREFIINFYTQNELKTISDLQGEKTNVRENLTKVIHSPSVVSCNPLWGHHRPVKKGFVLEQKM